MEFEQILPYAIFGFMAILLLVFSILSMRAWKIVHIMILFMVFIAMSATLIMLSAAFRTRSDWIARHKDNKDIAEQKQKEYEELIYGPEGEVRLVRNSLLGMDALLEMELIGRGRVWQMATPDSAGNNVATLKFPNSIPGTAAQIKEDMLLYVFKNESVDVDGTQTRLPVTYLATVRVTKSENDEVTVEGQFVADRAEFENKGATWTLYERMPADTPDAFRRAFQIDEDPAQPANADQYINNLRQKFTDLFQKPAAMPDDEYQSLVDRFVFDGMRTNDIGNWMRANGGTRVFDPEPEELFHKIVFNTEFRAQVDDTSQTLLNSGPIDWTTGFAVDPVQKANTEDGTVAMEKGDSGLFDSKSAEEGVRGTVTKKKIIASDQDAVIEYTVYQRRLIDFPQLLERTRKYTELLVLQEARLQQNIKLSAQSIVDLTAQKSTRSTIFDNLSTDNKNLQEDLTSIQELLKLEQRELDDTRQKINDLYADISQKHTEITRKSRLLLQKQNSNGGGQ